MGSRRVRNLVYKGVSLIITLSIFTQSATPLLAMPQPRPAGTGNSSSTESVVTETSPPAVLEATTPTLPTGRKLVNAAKPLTIPAAQEVDLDALTLLPGWSLLATPKVTPTTDPSAVFAPIAGDYNVVYAYDGCPGHAGAAPWQVFDPAAPPATNDLTTITHKIGFWIQTSVTTTLPLAGTIPPTSTIELCEGWNLIGLPMEQARPVRNALYSIEGNYSLVFGYDPADAADPWQIYDTAAPDWANDLELMLPGRGYWVLATEDATLTIANEGAPPIAEITSPDETTFSLTAITTFTDVVGTADSNILQNWTLAYRPVGEANWTTFASSVTPVRNDTFGLFDPTLLINGLYEIGLTVEDYAGQSSSVAVRVTVEGSQKLGIFTLEYVDVKVPVAGFPIQVIRRYDSRDKRVGDFGVGWTLDVSNVQLQETDAPGDLWQGYTSGGLFPTYCVYPSAAHIVTLTLPDDTVYKFRPTAVPQCQPLVPQSSVVIRYEPLPGTQGTLAPLDQGTQAVVVGSFPGPVQLWDEASTQIHDPNLYQLTTEDGRQLVISQEDGLHTVTDLNGNTLTMSAAGITHSDGLGLQFQRDGQNRIVQITDPISNTINYTYDENGDLTQVTAADHSTSSYAYNDDHYLLSIEGADGIPTVRSEYDENGRLLRYLDASGNIITYTHNLAARQEIVTDRLGYMKVYEYDERGNILQITDALSGVERFTYDALGNRTSQTNANGHTTLLSYEPSSRLISTVTDPLSNTHTYTYNDQGRVLTALDRAGNTITNTYDAAGNLVGRDFPDGRFFDVTPDDSGNILAETNSLGCTFQYEYDANGRLQQAINPLGYATLYTHDIYGNVTSETISRTLPSGVTETLLTSYEYNDANQLVRTTYPDSSVTRTEYNILGQKTADIDELGRITRYDYNAVGLLILITYPDTTTESFTYDAEGHRLTQTDRRGLTTHFVYDPLGRLVKTTYPDNTFTTTTYDLVGRPIAQTDERNHTTQYEYTPNGQLAVITNSLGFTTTYTYDALGNRLTMSDANGYTTQYEYDGNNQNIAILYPDGTSEQKIYDLEGNLIADIDQAGHRTSYGYDCLGRLISVTDALSQTTTYSYDTLNNLVSQTNARGHTTTFAYDARGRVLSRTLPMGQVETMSYDRVGNLISKTDFNGDTISYVYDVNNYLTEKSYPGGGGISYTYLPTGQRSTVTDRRGLTTYLYNERGGLLSVTDPDTGTITYAYDPVGNRTALSTGTFTTTYQYNDLDQLTAVSDPAGGQTSYTYDPVGNLATVVYANGAIAEYSYDSLNRLTVLVNQQSGGTPISSYQYQMDAAGNRTHVTEESGRTVAYRYDDTYRLLAETINDPLTSSQAISYTYDLVGNRLTKIENGQVTSSVYDHNDRLTSQGGTTFVYDDNGNLIAMNLPSGDHVLYGYDLENRLTEATIITSTLTTVITFTYNADGLRVQSSINGQDVTNYQVDPNQAYPQVIREWDGAGNPIAIYTYGHDLISALRPSGITYYHYDGQLSTRQLTDASQTVTDQYRYDAFGVLLAQSGTTPNNYLYTGEQYTPGIDSYYLRARYYQPATGRFLTADPFTGFIEDPHTLHKYHYTGNNPVNRIDPSGLMEGGMAGTMTATAGNGIVGGIVIPNLVRIWLIRALIVATVKVAECAQASVLTYFGLYGQQFSTNPCSGSIPIIYWGAVPLPMIALHTAIAQFSGYPSVLHYAGGGRHPSTRHLCYAAYGPPPGSLPPTNLPPLLFQCDEYPYFSTEEGQTARTNKSLSLMWVDALENAAQGGYLSVFYRTCKLQAGSPMKSTFGVMVVPSSLTQPYTC
jgi:RHS repeat-associated protein